MIRTTLCAIAAALAFASSSHGEPAPGAADSDAIAISPLDAERSLEIYGQPVASELAHAMTAARLPVVMIGPRVAVPERARLIVDGTIASGKAAAVTIALRIRDARDGAVLETLSATAPSLAKIDAAAAELSARLPALIRGRLAALRKPPPADSERARAVEARKPSAADPGVAVALADAPPGSSAAILRSALEPAIVEWARAHHRELHSIAPAAVAAKTIAARGTGLAIGLWPLEYRADAHPLPMARARVRVQISDARTVVFDRVVVTDTVLGERGMAPADVAARVAREILAILRPHLRRSVPAW